MSSFSILFANLYLAPQYFSFREDIVTPLDVDAWINLISPSGVIS